MDASVIEDLAALQTIDHRNREREKELADIERETAARRSMLDERRRQAELTRGEASAIGTRRRDLEGQLQQEEQKMKERRMRLGRLRNDKEVAALQREIELGKESNARLEEEVLTLIEQAEALEGSLREAEAEVAALEADAAKLGKAGGGRLRQLREEIEAGRAERSAIAARLNEGLRKKYEQIFSRRGGVAVVEARDGGCRGCNMNLPPQLYIEIQRRREVHVCPNCHRILIWRPSVAETANGDDS